MSDALPHPRPARRKWISALMLAGLGLLGGAPAGFFVGRLIKHAGAARAPGWSEELSLGIAALLTISGAAVMVATLSGFMARYLADPHADEPGRRVSRPQLEYFRINGAVMLLAGLMLATPVLIPLALPDTPQPMRVAAYAALVAVFLVQTALNLMLWLRSDELVRRAIGETSAASFWLLQGALFLWAAGERLGLLPALRAWDGMTVLMAAYLIMSGVVAYRRGLA